MNQISESIAEYGYTDWPIAWSNPSDEESMDGAADMYRMQNTNQKDLQEIQKFIFAEKIEQLSPVADEKTLAIRNCYHDLQKYIKEKESGTKITKVAQY